MNDQKLGGSSVKKQIYKSPFFLVWFIFLAFIACTQQTDTSGANQIDLGLSSDRLERIGTTIEKSIDEERIAGAVALVARRGNVAYLKAFGMMDKEAQMPMRTDTIFRICSMTKPITSVAVMMLYEEGHFMLNDPIRRFIPEFKDMKVLNPPYPEDQTSPPDSLEKARGPIRIRHLLTHTSGLTYNWDPRLGKMYNDYSMGHGLVQQEGTIGEAVKRLTNIPLMFHPGDQWMYGVSDDVLGYLVEVVSGMTLAEFFEERIFGPLGMKDSHFYLSDEKAARLAAVYCYFKEKGLQRFPEEPLSANGLFLSADYPYNGPKTYFSGGGGLCSTAEDYFRFCQMLLNGGELDGTRLLSPKSVELISQNHVGELLEGMGYGLGFGTYSKTSHLSELGSVGAYYWGGFFYTSFIIDPKEEMIAIFMGQLYPTGGLNLSDLVRNLAYQAIID
jgi:CubicO group peptidase (beta-lactamase class C family)